MKALRVRVGYFQRNVRDCVGVFPFPCYIDTFRLFLDLDRFRGDPLHGCTRLKEEFPVLESVLLQIQICTCEKGGQFDPNSLCHSVLLCYTNTVIEMSVRVVGMQCTDKET